MAQQISGPLDRPQPGHYRDRLSAVLGDVSVAGDQAWTEWSQPTTRRRVVGRSRRRRTGQLALPLESFRG